MAKVKTKLEKHLEELGESTSGGAHDAVTFSGKGLNFLRDLFKGEKPKKDDDRLEDEDEDEDDEDEMEKNEANGGDWEEEDEDDLEDPGQEGPQAIITNKGKRVSGAGAVKKHFEDDYENILEKSFDDFEDDYEEVLDASDALAELSKNMRVMAKSTTSSVAELKEQNMLLGKAVRELLKSQAALAADLELVKKQPAGSPASGFVVLNKGEAGGKGRRLSKSEVMDVVTDAMNDGLIESRALTQLRTLNTEAELNAYVNNLPQAVREML